MALFLAVVYLVMLCARLNWVFDLFSHFRIQYAIGTFAVALFFLCLRQWKPAALVCVLFLLSLFDVLRHSGGTVPTSTAHFTVVQFNHLYTNPRLETVGAWLERNAEEFDIVVLQEATPESLKLAQGLKNSYPHQIAKVRDDAFGMILLSRYPFTQKDIIPLKGTLFENFMIRADIEIPGFETGVTVFALHALPPMGGAAQSQRNSELAAASAIVGKDRSEYKIFEGDWNITPYSPYFSDLLETTGLNYTAMPPTWPRPLPMLFRIPIDHILSSQSLAFDKSAIGPPLWSDHAPLIATFSLK